jgi:threonine/homoserine/homoserine lactone efflux protein
MLGTQHFALFVISGLILNVSPGQDTFYIVGRTLAQGRAAGLVSVAGISTGAVVHTLMAAFGLSAIFAASTSAFLIVKIAGALYLAYLGIRMLLSRDDAAADSPALRRENKWAIFRAAFLTNLLNPKVALFFLAFLPQFVAPTADSRVLTLLFLGFVFVFNGTIWCLVLVWTASVVSQRLRARSGAVTAMKRLAGALFVALGVRLAMSE